MKFEECSHGQINTVMAGFPGGTIVTGQCFLQAGHGSRALHVNDRVQLCPARGRLGVAAKWASLGSEGCWSSPSRSPPRCSSVCETPNRADGNRS